MQIVISDAAQRALSERLTAANAKLKVVYDTDGCGCAVSGVVQLWQVDAVGPNDKIAHDGPVSVIYEARQEVFFEEQIKLDYREADRSFSLKSNNQIYNPSMRIIDRVGGVTLGE